MREAELWRASGGRALTGRADGPGLPAPGRPATHTAAALRRVAEAAPAARLPGVELLGERARLLGLRRQAPWSCGGSFRSLPALDGWVGVSLARDSDRDLLPALTGCEVTDPWLGLARWLANTNVQKAEERMRLLGFPGGAIPTQPPTDRPAVVTQTLGRRTATARPLVVDFTSLWAGPLCARLVGLTGARVVKVESRTRPDGARATPVFFERMHTGHEMQCLDFDQDAHFLHELVARADLVLEASRPRALRALGLDARVAVAAGTSWLSITARGRDSDAVGFGDDVAASAGLVVWDRDEPLPVGDAIADPLTGVRAAAEAVDALSSDEARLIDVSMMHVCAEAAAA